VADDRPPPESPDGAGGPAKDRSLVGFYLALGLVAGLAVFAAWIWNPLRAARWERQVRAAYERGDVKTAADALDKLEAIGPAARPAFERLLAPNGAWYRGQIAQLAGRRENKWLLPVMVRLVREDRESAPVYLALAAAEGMSGRIFLDPGFLPRSRELGPAVAQGRERLLEWWEREGRDKYDR